MFTPVNSCLLVLPILPLFNSACVPLFTQVLLVFTYFYPCLFVFTYVNSCLPMFTTV